MEALAPVLSELSGLAIEINTEFFGMECRIYSVDSVKVSYNDLDTSSLTFSSEPIFEGKLLVPELVYRQTGPATNSGVYTEFRDPILAYPPNILLGEVARKYLIVFNDYEVGNFIIEEHITNKFFKESLFMEVALVPYEIDVVKNEELIDDIAQDIVDDLDSPASIPEPSADSSSISLKKAFDTFERV